MAGWEKEGGQWFQRALWPKFERCTLRQMATTWASRGRELKRRCPESLVILEIQPSV